MNYSHEVEKMCTLAKGPKHGPAPIPEEGQWVKAYEIKDISGLHNKAYTFCIRHKLYGLFRLFLAH